MISMQWNVYINNLTDTVNEYNNTYHSTIELKPADLKSDMYIDSAAQNNDKDPEFEICKNIKI